MVSSRASDCSSLGQDCENTMHYYPAEREMHPLLEVFFERICEFSKNLS